MQILTEYLTFHTKTHRAVIVAVTTCFQGSAAVGLKLYYHALSEAVLL